MYNMTTTRKILIGILLSLLTSPIIYSQGYRGVPASVEKQNNPGQNKGRRPGGDNSSNNRPNNPNPGNNHNWNNGNSNWNNGKGNWNNGNHNGNYRPTTPPSPGQNRRPGYGQAGNPGAPKTNHRDDYRNPNSPRYDYSWNPVAPPARPYRPVRPLPRPLPPPNYRPYHGAPVIDNILGLAFGTAAWASVNYLHDKGYYIDGYSNTTVYLRDVRQLMYNWPDVILNYDSFRRLISMQFIYSTSYDDSSRYSRLYSDLCSSYGPPVTYQQTRGGYECVWYGAGARNFVTLEYDMNYASNGRPRFYTILSYGK